MAHLIMSDGEIRKVDYNTAAKVFAVLNGTKKPEDEEQAKFIERVQEVDFSIGDRAPVATPAAGKIVKKHDPVMDEILADPKLKGVAKAKAVAKRIKERRL